MLAAVAARVLGERAAAATAVSPSLAPGELDDARAVAEAVGIRHIEVKTDEVEDPAYAANTIERCFHCKDTAYGVFAGLAEREGFAVVIDGTNADDKGDYRPGRRAASSGSQRAPVRGSWCRSAASRRPSAPWARARWSTAPARAWRRGWGSACPAACAPR